MTARAAFSATAMVLGMLCTASSQPPGPPKSPPPGEGRGQLPDGARRHGDWRGFSPPGMGRPPMRSEEYEKLPEEDRRHVREALDRVWWRPEVMAAREKTMKAHAELRESIRRELEKSDPRAAAILARVEPAMPMAGSGGAPLPPVDSEEYPREMLARFGREMLAFAKPERQDEARRFHERIIHQPPLQEALSAARAARGEERIQAIQRMRALYRETAVKEFQQLRDRRPSQDEAGKSQPARP